MPTAKATADYNLANNRLIRKLDMTLLPLLTFISVIGTVDRGAVGNAKIAGFERDLGLNGLDYNVGISLFSLFYIGCQIPSNIALKQVGSVWLACLVIAFGLVSISTAFIRNYAGFMTTRILLGATESGLIPGITYLLSLYYPRSKLIVRITIFYTLGGALAGVFGGFLASGLLAINSIGSVVSWRKIFLVEGIITTALGILCVFIVPGHPRDSRLLTENERALVLEIAKNGQFSDAAQMRIHPRLILRSFTFHIGLCALGLLINSISLGGLAVFLPSIIANSGKLTIIEVQLLTVPPYLVSGVFAVGIAYMAYRLRQRGIFLAISIIINLAGYAVFVGSNSFHIRYGACFLALTGTGGASSIFLSWAAENSAPETVRAIAIAIVIGAGAIGSLVSVWAYLPNDAPKYRHAHTVNLVGACINFFLAIIGVLYIKRENAKRDDGKRDNRLNGKSQAEIEELGSQHPEYRYQP